MNSAKKQRKRIEWERLEISSRKLERPREHSCKDGQNKGQKWYGPNRRRDIQKRWQEYTELYNKDIHDPDDRDGVITHLEPDILECEVKRALGSITTNKASGGDRIPNELLQILKDDAVRKIQQWPELAQRSRKGEFSLQSQRKEMTKNVQATLQLGLFHMLAK